MAVYIYLHNSIGSLIDRIRAASLFFRHQAKHMLVPPARVPKQSWQGYSRTDTPAATTLVASPLLIQGVNIARPLPKRPIPIPLIFSTSISPYYPLSGKR